jgi:hypothetical protein
MKKMMTMKQEMLSWQLQWHVQAAVSASELAVPIYSCHRWVRIGVYAWQVLSGIHVGRVAHQPPHKDDTLLFCFFNDWKRENMSSVAT